MTSRVAILVYTMPIWAALFALADPGRTVDATRILALALCVAGMTILISPLSQSGIPVGIMLAVATGVSWAAGTVYLKWARIEGDPIAVTIWQLVFCVVCHLRAAVRGRAASDASAPRCSARCSAGIIGSGLCYFLWFRIVRRLPAMTASLGILSSPVIGVIDRGDRLGERPTG